MFQARDGGRFHIRTDGNPVEPILDINRKRVNYHFLPQT